MFKNYTLNIIPTLVLVVFFSAPLLTFFVDFSWLYAILLIINFIWFGLSSSLYYHRTLSHRAAELHPLIHLLFLLGGTISLSGSPIDWVVIHRYHHSNSDKESDPHSPLHGRFWSYIGWIILRDKSLVKELKKKYCSDLIENKLIVGETPNTKRKDYLERFGDEKDNLSILINFDILATGIDVPGLNSIMILRNIQSAIIALQILGRAMRGKLNGGNEENTIFLTKDNQNRLIEYKVLEDQVLNN